jgi:(4S)-4-hydroxy-5-phosphonooxypentane-2,3-dione isomerase
MSAVPVVLIVQVDIVEDRINEFLQVMERDAIDSRTLENGGCLRFDVIKVSGSSNKFCFYESYTNQAALDFHITTPHFQAWNAFKESGGVLSVVVIKGEGTFYTN